MNPWLPGFRSQVHLLTRLPMLRAVFCLSVVIISSSTSYADPFQSEPGLVVPDREPIRYEYNFLLPNESHPQDAKPILAHSTTGVYVSVGTERGLIGAAQSNATELLLVDSNSEAVVYNKSSIILLKASRGNSDYYRSLKTRPDFLLAELGTMDLNETEKSFLRAVAISPWWRVVSENLSLSELFGAKPSRGSVAGQFLGANYVADEVMFKKLFKMAIENKIWAIQRDLADAEAGWNIRRELEYNRLRISVLDLSNAWMSSYISPEGSFSTLKILRELLGADSIILITRPDRQHAYFWTYYGSKFSDLKKRHFFGQNQRFYVEPVASRPRPDWWHRKTRVSEDRFLDFFKVASAWPKIEHATCEALFRP